MEKDEYFYQIFRLPVQKFREIAPHRVIRGIGERSRDLILQIGKVTVSGDQSRKQIEVSGFRRKVEASSAGGLWWGMRK